MVSDKEFIKLLAKTIKRAAEIKENSWVPNDDKESMVTGGYTKGMEQSVQEAFKETDLPEPMWFPIYLGFHWWNDILGWADAIENDTWKTFFVDESERLEGKAAV